MAAWTAAARQAANLARLSTPKSASTAQAASLVHRRGLAGGGGRSSWTSKGKLLAGPVEPISVERRTFRHNLIIRMGIALLWRVQAFQWRQEGQERRGESWRIITVGLNSDRSNYFGCLLGFKTA